LLSLHDGLMQECRVYHHAPEIKFTIVHPTFAATPLITPFGGDLKSSKQFILDPQVVSDAVVQQIMQARGRQILLAGGGEFVSGIRGWPHYISQGLIRVTDRTIVLEKWNG